jgi:DNA-binding SARP family transcriptional activator
MAPDDLPAFVQLEDHEWTRIALGLASTSPARPLAWRLGPDSLAGILPPIPLTGGSSSVARVAQELTLLAPPMPLARGDGNHPIWLLHKDATAIDALPPTPRVLAASRRAGLVTLWQRAGIRCLLDVMAAGSVGIDGPPVAVGSALSEIVVELGSRRWCDLDEVYLVGFGRELHGLADIRFLAEVRDALALLRSSDPDSAPSRCFVVAPAPPRTGERGNLVSLMRLAAAHGRASVVCCEPSLPVNMIWRLAARGETLHLEVRQPLGPVTLLDPRDDSEPTAAADPDGYHRDEHTADDGGADHRGGSAIDSDDSGVHDLGGRGAPAAIPRSAAAVLARRLSPGPFVAPPPAPAEAPPRPDAVEIRVLGGIEILGTAEPVDHRPRLTELLVYLAFHRDSVERDSFGAALWPERRIPGQTIANRLSEARRALGASADGRNRLRRVHGRLHLADDVVTDWDRFGELTSEGSGPQSWRLALSQVRGRPFQGLAQAEWTVLEGYAAAVERAVVEAALALGDYSLSASNPAAADWAAQQGLLASPWDERLYRLLMRSAEAAGNRGAIDAALRSLAQVLELRGDPLLGVHPTTAQLYRSLMQSGGPEPPPGRSSR